MGDKSDRRAGHPAFRLLGVGIGSILIGIYALYDFLQTGQFFLPKPGWRFSGSSALLVGTAFVVAGGLVAFLAAVTIRRARRGPAA